MLGDSGSPDPFSGQCPREGPDACHELRFVMVGVSQNQTGRGGAVFGVELGERLDSDPQFGGVVD